MARGRSRSGLETSCPACGAEMFFRRRPTRGQFVTCHNCDSLLEVLRLSPLELEWAFEDPLDVVYRERHQDGDEWEGDDYEGYEVYEEYNDPDAFDDMFDDDNIDHGHGNGHGNGRGDGRGSGRGDARGNGRSRDRGH